jgi:hypothetical protein
MTAKPFVSKRAQPRPTSRGAASVDPRLYIDDTQLVHWQGKLTW